MENINVQVYSLVSEPISPIEKLKTIGKAWLCRRRVHCGLHGSAG